MPYSLKDLTRLIARQNFCILATQGLYGPHVAGVGYFAHGLDLYIPTSANTTKARNIRPDPRVAVHIPVPWPLVPAPPRSIQFRGKAEILPMKDPTANEALRHGSLVIRRVFHRLMDRADEQTWGESIWIHVQPGRRIETFLIGVPPTSIFRDEKKATLHFHVPRKDVIEDQQGPANRLQVLNDVVDVRRCPDPEEIEGLIDGSMQCTRPCQAFFVTPVAHNYETLVMFEIPE
jgi:nitroimidazol reductase NimA-like FMN-containing flavoprotein (pyridoxamine 5'-phosphate oxidase superfamily)